MKPSIVFTGGTLSNEDIEQIESLGFRISIQPPDLSEDKLIKALDGAQIYILGGAEKATARVFEEVRSLKVLAFLGVGYQSFVDVEAATKHGVAVTNTPHANAQSVSEFTIALMLDAVKRLTYLIRTTKQGGWPEYKTWDLNGRNLGILGMGSIGSRVAHIARAGFGMNIYYHSRSRKPEVEQSLGAEYLSLTELLKESDVVSVHASYGKQTIGLIGNNELRQVKETAVLVNCARAELVEPHALRDALASNRLAVAAFDGYYIEPSPAPDKDPYGLIGLSDEKFLLAPHTAYLTADSIRTMLKMNLESISNLMAGKGAPYVVNPEYEANVT